MLAVVFSVSAAGADSKTGPHFSTVRTPIDLGKEWQEQPFTRDPVDKGADLVVVVNQQFDSFLRPAIAGYARTHGLDIRIKKGTCGLASGGLQNKVIELGSFCCPPADFDRLPGLSF
ncbi:MAG: hypothetical protein GY820_29885, partial [Gammaproteobacteria bacterium]|nr:hypothetical protein [Gammaproteobacteria bacterium]